MKSAVCLFAVMLLFACKPSLDELPIPGQSLVKEAFIPCTLNPDTTRLVMQDYIPDVSLIEGVSGDSRLSIQLSEDHKTCTIISTDVNVPPLSLLKIKAAGHNYSLLLKRSRKIKQQIRYVASSDTIREVQLAGDINGWTPSVTPFTRNGNNWELNMMLNPGRYAYLLVVNGRWMRDKENKDSISNGMGGWNSVLNVGAQPHPKRPFIYPSYSTGSLITLNAKNEPEHWLVLWDNFDITGVLERSGQDWLIHIPDRAKDKPASELRIWSWNRYGVSNDILVPLRYGHAVKKPADVQRKDKWGMSIYFLMPDRFFDGKKDNNHPVADPEIAQRANYLGGDLEGIRQKIKSGYFRQLGFNTLWISPTVANPQTGFVEYPAPHRKYSGYHGYWPVSCTQTDARFGSNEEMRKLVKTAHAAQLNVLVDFVSNHVHQEHPLYRQHPDWFTGIDLPDGRKNIRLWDEYRISTWFDTFLPDIDYSKPEVVNAMSDSAVKWFSMYDIDGFRHDATKHVPEAFWRALTTKIKKQQRESVYQIGETFGSRELIGSYVSSGMQDAQFDFNLYFDARSSFLNSEESFEKLASSLQESFDYYGYHHLMGNVSGNHDLPRFISYAGEGLSMQENDKEAGWSREITVKNKNAYKKLAQLIAFNASIPGIPVLYYGDEIGMPGAGDPDNRRMMKFSNLKAEEKAQKELTSKIMNIRKSHMALICGDFDMLHAKGSTMAYGRYYLGNAAFVFFNKSAEKKIIKVKIPDAFKAATMKRNFGAKWQLKAGYLEVELLPYSFEILCTESL
jgi:glycosidase